MRVTLLDDFGQFQIPNRIPASAARKVLASRSGFNPSPGLPEIGERTPPNVGAETSCLRTARCTGLPRRSRNVGLRCIFAPLYNRFNLA